jgi:putative redox protein
MSAIIVGHHSGDRFHIAIRGHELIIDQPLDMGGDDTGPTPTELFVAGLASCVAFYARRFLARHDLDTEGLAVTAEYELADRPARVAAITLRVVTPTEIPPGRRAVFEKVIEHCTVHNSLKMTPTVQIVHEPHPQRSERHIATLAGVERALAHEPSAAL